MKHEEYTPDEARAIKLAAVFFACCAVAFAAGFISAYFLINK